MFRHIISYKKTFVLILYTMLFMKVHAISDICKICTCKSSENIDCRNRQLTSVPQPIPTNVESLVFSKNDISSIEESIFRGLTRLQLLSLSFNKIEKIEREFFRDLTNLQLLFLYGNNISSIDQGSFQSLRKLKTLNLSINKIEKIERGIFHNLTNLQNLYLNRNNILDVDQRSFQSLTRLKILYLNRNNISSIEKGIFHSLTKLVALELSFNEIEKIEPGIFNNLTNLHALYLGFNNIEKLERGIFHNLAKLQTLYCAHNNIDKIERGIFHHLTKLETLDLNSNNISSIEQGSFQGLTSLHILYLGHNKIEKIERGIFQSLTNLLKLFLSFNKIKKIEHGIFYNLTNLNKLYLNSNNISSIEQGSLQSLTRLRLLSLSVNKLKKIEGGFFRGLTKLQELYLDNNEIQKYDDGAFLFLPSIALINIRNNSGMLCGCHLPAFVNYTKRVYNRHVKVYGDCHTDLGKVVPIREYSQCQNYSLFQRNLQCQTCSGMMCSDSDVTICPGAEPVCRFTLSMEGVTLKAEKSCSTYKQCVEAMKNNTLTCNKWTNGSSCVGCCVGNLCNKKDFIGWTKSFVFYLTFEKLNEYNTPAERISGAIEHNLSTLMGAFNVEYCGLDGNKSIFVMNCGVLSQITKNELRRNILRVLNTSQALLDKGVQQRHMKLIDEMVCDQSTTSTNEGTFFWPMTKAGTTLTIPCHANVATRHCSSRTVENPELASSQSMSSPKCSPFTGIWQEPDMSQCYNTEWITRRLKDIKSQDIDKRNIDSISKEILNISQMSVYFKEEDITLAVAILEKMVPLISEVSANITLDNILLSINNLLNIPDKILAGAEQKNRSANRLLDIMETIPEKIPLEEEQVTVLYSNLGIGVAKVDKDTSDGLLYGVSHGTNERKANILISHSPNADQEEADIKITAFISLPTSLLKQLKGEQNSTISRISFFSMRNDKLYRVTQNSSVRQNARINSHVLAAHVPNISMRNLEEPVNISFHLIQQNAIKPQCVSWDESPGLDPHWSSKGCHVSKYEPGEEVVCSCDQLTTFAVLMDVYEDEGERKHDKALSIITTIGCGISFVLLILTIIIHVCFRNLWDLISSKILVSLCSSLAVTNLIVCVQVQPYAQVTAVCKALAALLHYFLITSLMWMSVEGFHIFLSVVVDLKTYRTSFMKRSSILAWGAPAIIVMITLAINYRENYAKIANVCWLSGPSFYAAFLVPVVIIIFFNLIMLSRDIWRLISMAKEQRSEYKGSKVRVLGLVGLLLLFGLTWVFASFAIRKDTLEFTLLFIIFNCFQGIFIFIFYCLYKKDSKDVLREFMNKRKGDNHRKLINNRSSRSGDEILDRATDSKL